MAAKRGHDVRRLVDLTGGGKLPARVFNDVIDLVDSDEEGLEVNIKSFLDTSQMTINTTVCTTMPVYFIRDSL